MDREHDVIELGVASEETKGGGFLTADDIGQLPVAGLSDD